MSERKLRNRKRRAGKGRRIALSDLVYREMNAKRHGKSWDQYFRWLLGLPDRTGAEQPIVEGVLETTTGIFVLRMPQTAWKEVESVVEKMAERVARKQTTKVSPGIRMRELR